jgi:hypothetical protein
MNTASRALHVHCAAVAVFRPLIASPLMQSAETAQPVSTRNLSSLLLILLIKTAVVCGPSVKHF